MSPLMPIVLAVLLALPVAAFYLTVESSRRKLLVGLRTCDDVEAVLANKPWYVSRGQLVAWEYLLVEAEACGDARPQRHLSRVGATGRRLWIVWQGAQPTPLFHPWTSAAHLRHRRRRLRTAGLPRRLDRAGDRGGGCRSSRCAATSSAAGRLQRDDEDWRLGARLRPLLKVELRAGSTG